MNVKHELAPSSTQHIGRHKVVAYAVMLNLLDGFDVLAISFAAPSISAEWALTPQALGLLFSASITGVMVASLFLAGLADYAGRRKAILLSLVVLFVGMIGSANSNSLYELAIWRFMVGLAVGVILPVLTILVVEIAPPHRRDFSVAVMQAGFPAGGIVGGFVAIAFVENIGWRGIFWVGAIFTAAALVVAWRRLPESEQFLIARRPVNALQRLNAARSQLALPVLDELPEPAQKHSSDVGFRAALNKDVFMRILPISLGFFFASACFYFVANWTPQLLVQNGLQLSAGLSGGITLSVGGILGGLLLGWVARKYGSLSLTMIYMIATAPAMWAFTQATGLPFMLLSAFIMGFFQMGSIMGLYMLTPTLFNTTVRTTATGISIGLGRIGAISGPIITGYLMSVGWTADDLYLAFAYLMLGSAIFLVPLRGKITNV